MFSDISGLDARNEYGRPQILIWCPLMHIRICKYCIYIYIYTYSNCEVYRPASKSWNLERDGAIALCQIRSWDYKAIWRAIQKRLYKAIECTLNNYIAWDNNDDTHEACRKSMPHIGEISFTHCHYLGLATVFSCRNHGRGICGDPPCVNRGFARTCWGNLWLAGDCLWTKQPTRNQCTQVQIVGEPQHLLKLL